MSPWGARAAAVHTWKPAVHTLKPLQLHCFHTSSRFPNILCVPALVVAKISVSAQSEADCPRGASQQLNDVIIRYMPIRGEPLCIDKTQN